MKQRILLAGSFGIFLLLLGLCLTLSVAAIDTPWIPLEPNTTVKPAETTVPKPAETTAPSVTGEEEPAHPAETREEPVELETGEPVGESSRETSREESGTPSATADQKPAESSAKRKKGCGGTLSGAALLFPLAIAAAGIGRKKSREKVS